MTRFGREWTVAIGLFAALTFGPLAAAEPPADDSARPSAIETLVERASLERVARDPQAEVALWIDVLERDPSHPAAHERLAEMTGPADHRRVDGADAIVSLAIAHPYDPRALLRAGEVLAANDRVAEAVGYLEKAVWLADIDPVAALDSLVLLRKIDPVWRARRVVPVHVYADEAIRAQAGWMFRMRTLWLAASNALDGVVETRFVPIQISAFRSARMANDLDAIYADFTARVEAPVEGLLALVAGRAIPDGEGVFKKGTAEFLGRRIAIRLEAGASKSRVLAHELLHLYGAIHVLDDMESLMNPTGVSLNLDPGSFAIARAMVARLFVDGGIEQTVLPVVNLRAATDAFVLAIGTNLAFREAGILEARASGYASPEEAASRAQVATRLDPHFADAARVVAALMIADRREPEAIRLLELAAALYGLDSPNGIRTTATARSLRDASPDRLRESKRAGQPEAR